MNLNLFVSQAPQHIQTKIANALREALSQDYKGDELEAHIQRGLDSRIIHLEDTINLNTVVLGKTSPQMVQDWQEEGFALCVCGDCGEIAPEWEECETTRFQPNGEAWNLECGHWADCPHCDTITGVEICSCSLPGGKDFDYQFKLKHFGEMYEPTLEEVVSCLREEEEDDPFNRWVSSGQCADDMAGETDPQEE